MSKNCQTVLIVDDEEDLTWSISRRLGKAWDHIHILCANSGKEALQIMGDQTVDLLITDIRNWQWSVVKLHAMSLSLEGFVDELLRSICMILSSTHVECP